MTLGRWCFDCLFCLCYAVVALPKLSVFLDLLIGVALAIWFGFCCLFGLDLTVWNVVFDVSACGYFGLCVVC